MGEIEKLVGQQFARPVAYIMCGYCFAGKSTLAAALAARLHFVHIDVDQTILDRIGRPPTRSATDEDWEIAYGELFQCVGQALDEGRGVICDGVNASVQERDELRAVIDSHGGSARVIFVDVAESEVRRRREANRASRVRHDVADSAFERIIQKFERPSERERPISWTPADSMEIWIAKLLVDAD